MSYMASLRLAKRSDFVIQTIFFFISWKGFKKIYHNRVDLNHPTHKSTNLSKTQERHTHSLFPTSDTGARYTQKHSLNNDSCLPSDSDAKHSHTHQIHTHWLTYAFFTHLQTHLHTQSIFSLLTEFRLVWPHVSLLESSKQVQKEKQLNHLCFF